MHWYSKQTLRWDKLKKLGCTFTDEGTEKFVGLGLSIGNKGIVVMVPKNLSFQEIHTTILKTCENFCLKNSKETKQSSVTDASEKR